jgi:hypothetical protein
MEVDIQVECSITGNTAEYEYDTDNTLLAFITDVNNDSPALGFSPSSVKSGKTNENSGIVIDGTGYRFLDNSGSTLADLGAKMGSLIVITRDAPSCISILNDPSEETVTGATRPTLTVKPNPLKKKETRSKLKKITRPAMKKKPPRVIRKIDPNTMNNLQLMKAAALNEIEIGAGINSIGQLKSHLNQLVQTGKKIKFSLPKKFRKKSFVTPLGPIKYSNILLWCDGTKDIDLSTMHLYNACVELFEDTGNIEDVVGDKVFKLLNQRCQTPGCNGTFRLWNLKDNPPKFV